MNYNWRLNYVPGLDKEFQSNMGTYKQRYVDYDPSKMSGSPYSVSQNEVENLFSKKGTLEVLETRNNLEDRMRERGLDWLNETVYLFEKN